MSRWEPDRAGEDERVPAPSRHADGAGPLAARDMAARPSDPRIPCVRSPVRPGAVARRAAADAIRNLCDRTAVPRGPLMEGLHARLARDADDAGIRDVACLTLDSPGPEAAGHRIEGAMKKDLEVLSSVLLPSGQVTWPTWRNRRARRVAPG